MYLRVCIVFDSDRQHIFMGDDNALTLEVSAENRGEGAYEAELHVYPPPQADFTGVVRGSQVGRTFPCPLMTSAEGPPHWPCVFVFVCMCVCAWQTLNRLSCAYKKENQTKMVVCDLGNPMKGGAKVGHMTRLRA